MYTFRRYLTRIGIPFAIVFLVSIGAKIYLSDRFFQENVKVDASVSEPEELDAASEIFEVDEPAPEYSDSVKSQAVSQARMALGALENSLGSSSVDEAAEVDRAEVEAAIEKLEAASADNWASRYETAYSRLRAYASAAGAEIGDAGAE